MRTRLAKSLVLLALPLLFTGCPEQQSASITPGDGRTNVPVNVIIQAKYTSDYPIRKADLQTKNFRLSSCDSNSSSTKGEPKTEEAKPAAEGTSPKTEGTAAAKTQSGGTSVEGKVLIRNFSVTRTYNSGEKKKLVQTEVLFLPVSSSWEETPLKENSSYCFTAPDVKDDKGNVVMGATTQFFTEESTAFQFDQKPEWAKWMEPVEPKPNTIPELSSKEILLIHFSGPFHPNDALSGVTVCSQGKATEKVESNADSPCDGSGVESRKALYLIERLEQKDGLYLASFNMYGVGQFFESSKEYQVRVGVDENSPVPIDPEIDFKANSDLKMTDVALLLAPDDKPSIVQFPLLSSKSRQ